MHDPESRATDVEPRPNEIVADSGPIGASCSHDYAILLCHDDARRRDCRLQ